MYLRIFCRNDILVMEAVNTWDLVKHYMQPVAQYLDMPGVTEILIDRFDKIYIEKNGCFEEVSTQFKNNAEVEKLIEQLGNALNQPVHRDKFPFLDARLPNSNGRTGARIHAVMAPVSTRGACITIRVFPLKVLTATDLLNNGALTNEMLEFLKLAVLCRMNIIISGGTGSGKTTLTNVLCSFIPKNERVITIEDTAELQLSTPYLISMEAPRRKREAHSDTQVVDMAFLLQNALRQRPDRIIVGEIRFADAAMSFLQAINTGHAGCMTTLHANSAMDALARLEGLAAAKSDLPYDIIRTQVRGNIQLLIHQQRIPEQGRRVVEVAEVDEGETRPLWQWDYKAKTHGALLNINKSLIIERAKGYGISSSL